MPGPDSPYLFNGDFVDRGSFSIEIILMFFSFKLLYPSHFHMLRGNHETINMNSIYGFQGEVTAKVDTPIFGLFTEVFNLIPLAAVLQKKVLVVHGGLFSDDTVTLDQIKAIDRNQQPPESGLMTELLWSVSRKRAAGWPSCAYCVAIGRSLMLFCIPLRRSDPQKMRGRAPSKRGVGLSFGPDVTAVSRAELEVGCRVLAKLCARAHAARLSCFPSRTELPQEQQPRVDRALARGQGRRLRDRTQRSVDYGVLGTELCQ
jgi:serine/threonine-protein phosphatase 5